MKIRLSKQEIDWIERTADIETSRLFENFNRILSLREKVEEKSKELLDKQVDELIDLYTFLKVLRSKLEVWDSRFDIDSEQINSEDKSK